ncbi:hypothetical protein AB0I52_18715 [Streptomyces sp. NPDC050423]|uniref:nSTAND1 domain-containing NTPase n=1 Tax=Streptomyces sp. NPDC050423 TaxID=3155402 RepID=UPI003436B46C
MGRRERPLDMDGGPVAEFAGALRKLRDKAGGITYRAMAGKGQYSAATLAQAAAGVRLPTLPVVIAYVRACEGDCEEWEERWQRAVREVGDDNAASEAGNSPYPGLARFDVEDHDRFFGRDHLVDELVDLFVRREMVVLVGPSGSGKSSLLRAGLLHRVRQGATRGHRTSTIRILTPGPRPAHTHAGLLDPTAMTEGTLLVVDQFEEIFTQCSDPGERARFVELLCSAPGAGRGARVVIAVRADFYGHLTRYRALAEAARKSTLLVPPMSAEELREAIIKPAAHAGLVVERALTARLLSESADEDGSLPLVSHALLETWRHRRGRVLTEAAYDEAGGIHGAIARTAEDLYRRLSPDRADTARRILLRLVTPGKGSPDTRRPAPRAEITALGPGGTQDTELVLERLARARLITLDEDWVDLAHEAVLAAWPRLGSWLDASRDRVRAQRRLTEAAANWQSLQCDTGALYRGLRLDEAAGYFGSPEHSRELTDGERQFLKASLTARRRRHHRRRAGITVLSALLALSLLAGLAAWQQNRISEQRRREAEARRLVGTAAGLRLSDPQTAMRLSLAAWQVADLPETRSALLSAMVQKQQDVFTDPDSSAASMRHLTPDGRTLVSVGADRVARWDVDSHRRIDVRPGLGRDFDEAGFIRADARWLPVFGGEAVPVHGRRTVSLRDLTTGHTDRSTALSAYDGAEMTPSGRSLAVYDSDAAGYSVSLVDAETRRVLLRIEVPGGGGTDTGMLERIPWARQTALRQQLEMEHRPFTLMGGHSVIPDGLVPDATVSSDDRYLALCTEGERLQLWDVGKKRRISAAWLPEVTLEQCVHEHIVFSPDSAYLGVITDRGFRAWHIASGRELPPVEQSGLKTAVLSEDGSYLAASDGTEILVWRLANPDFPSVRHQLSGETVKDLRLDAASHTLRYLGGPEGSWGPLVHTLDLGPMFTAPWGRAPAPAQYSRSGDKLAVARPDPDGRHVRVRILDGKTGALLATPPRVPCPQYEKIQHCVVALAFDSTGRTLAYGVTEVEDPSDPGRIALYDVPRQRTTAVLAGSDLSGIEWRDIVFTPDDRKLVIAGEPGPSAVIRIWDVGKKAVTATIPDAAGRPVLSPDGALLTTTQGTAYRLPSGTPLPPSRTPGRATALAFSPDGKYLAVGDGSGRVGLWDGRITRRLGELADPDTSTSQYVSALAFTPDSRTLAVAGDEGSVQLWDSTTHQRIGMPLPTAGDTIGSLVFESDHVLRAAGSHTAAHTYELSPQAATRAICRRTGRQITPREWRAYLPEIPYGQTCPRRD